MLHRLMYLGAIGAALLFFAESVEAARRGGCAGGEPARHRPRRSGDPGEHPDPRGGGIPLAPVIETRRAGDHLPHPPCPFHPGWGTVTPVGARSPDRAPSPTAGLPRK